MSRYPKRVQDPKPSGPLSLTPDEPTAREKRRTEKCPHCGDPKWDHVPVPLDGVPMPPYECALCRRKCAW